MYNCRLISVARGIEWLICLRYIGLFQKKNRSVGVGVAGGGGEHAFLKTPLEFLGFLLYPWKFQTK